MYYWPRERDVEGSLMGAFALILHFDGRVTSRRLPGPRAYRDEL